MDKNLFFGLLQVALGNKELLPIIPLPKEWISIYEESERQAITGVMLGGIEKLPKEQRPPTQLLLQWIGAGQVIERQGHLVNKAVAELQRLHDNHGVMSVVVKGQVVATYYPNPLERQAGDVDYYCDEYYFQRSIKAIRSSWDVEPDQESSNKHVHYEHDGVTYEGHFLLINLYGKKRDAYWNKLLMEDRKTMVDIDGVAICTLSPTLHVLYIFLHLYHHLLELGVGLRQFCDMAVMLRYAVVELPLLKESLKFLGMEKAYRACGSILVDHLGLKEERLGYVLDDTDRHYGKKILDVVMYRGNMGHYNKRNGYIGLKHKLESIIIKLAHFFKFWRLAPGYSCAWFLSEFLRKI